MTSLRGKTLVKGHSLLDEGAPFDQRGTRRDPDARGGLGYAKCSCGAMSPYLHSDRQRKAWHRDVHKPQAARESG